MLCRLETSLQRGCINARRQVTRATKFYTVAFNIFSFTLWNITVNALHVSGCFSAHHQELKNCIHSIRYISSSLAATASMCEFQLTHPSGSSKQAWHIPDAVCTVFELLVMGGETA